MTEERIVEMYWSRDESAVEETAKLYGRYLAYIAERIVGNGEDADEIVNDTYFKAWDRIPPQRPVSLKAFLAKIVRQLAINRMEKNLAQKRGGTTAVLAFDELKDCVFDNGRSLSMEETVALREAINGFLRSLPLEKRRIFIRRYWYMNTVSEIAVDFAFSESKVKMMLLRMREQLKDHLEKEGIGL